MHDELLEWCSERATGTMDSFERAAVWLAENKRGRDQDCEPGLAAYQLQTLGHLEIDWEKDHWAIAPSCVTVLDDAGGNALLIGARPRWLMQRLNTLESDEDPILRDEVSPHVVIRDPVAQFGRNGPSAIYLTAPRDELIELLCERLAVRFENRVEERVRAVLPPLDTYLDAGFARSTPPGFAPRMLYPTRAQRWVDVDDDHQPGAYEYRAYGPPRYFFRNVDGTLSQTEKWIVSHAEVRRLGLTVLNWSSRGNALYVPAGLPLPLLYARCTVFRTGLLPMVLREPPKGLEKTPWRTWLKYENVPLKLARTVSDRLGQNLGIIKEYHE